MDDQVWAGVRERVLALGGEPSKQDRPVFGARGHRFRLEPVLTPAELADLEDQLGVRLPHEYRTFLLEVGAGGAGPAYGVFPVRRSDTRWGWTGDGAELVDPARLAEPFPAQGPDPELVEVEELLELVWHPDRTVGAIAICHLGCGVREWLVVSGPEAGRLWSDHRVDDVDLSPLRTEDGRPVTFRQWYLDWLANAERLHLRR